MAANNLALHEMMISKEQSKNRFFIPRFSYPNLQVIFSQLFPVAKKFVPLSMKSRLLLFVCIFSGLLACQSQTTNKIANATMTKAAMQFLQSLTPAQKAKAQFLFDDEERYHWHYVPMDRKGIPLKELTDKQIKGAMDLLHTALSDTGFEKTTAIIKLENVLREIENASPDYRNPGNYYFSIFGNPADSIWGWRLEGHHVSLNFSALKNQLISGSPGFLGANPAVVLSGPQKGLEILKDEGSLGLELLHALTAEQKPKAIINVRAPGDIITGNNRKAMIQSLQGIAFRELNGDQQKIFLQLLSIYLHRYKNELASKMMHDIEEAGLNNLRFAWAGAEEDGVGHPHYYRIQGPTIIIEYDNTQNNANHVHTVVRDLKNDFGGDELLEHYKNSKH